VTTPTLSAWWPPSGYEEFTEVQVRKLFAYPRTIVPPVMADARKRIQDRVGEDPIQVWPTTIEQLTGQRPNRFNGNSTRNWLATILGVF